jgi:Alcohol dehydrogenase GroES-like domain
MRPSTPFVPGTEAVGVVIAVGGKITRFQPGDRLACVSWTGGYAGRMIAKEWKSVRLPGSVAFETAARVWHKPITAKARPKGENVVDLMNALKRSIANDREAEPARSKKPRKTAAGQKEMLLPIGGKRAAKAEAKKAKPAASRARKRA